MAVGGGLVAKRVSSGEWGDSGMQGVVVGGKVVARHASLGSGEVAGGQA